jgi:hypothetical protein
VKDNRRKMNKEEDEFSCEVINKDLPGGNKGMNEISQNTKVFVHAKVRKEKLSNTSQKLYPFS